MKESVCRIDEEELGRLTPINALSIEQRRQLLPRTHEIALEPGERITADRDGGEQTYYLLHGEIGLYDGDRLLETIVGGTEDARFALHQLRARHASARAIGDARLLRVDVSLVSTLLIWMQLSQNESLQSLSAKDCAGWVPKVLGSELFARIPPANIEHIFNRLETVCVEAGDKVIRQGEAGEYYYIVREGCCAVSRTMQGAGSAVELARLEPGDGFGEEALITGTQRNATVEMLSDGKLLRMTKDDFRSLISEPVLSALSIEEGRRVVAGGGVWLDVRLTDEHRNNGIEGSVNIPLAELRERATELHADRPYVLYSDSGRRARAAAFLLAELGLQVNLLAGGLLGTDAPGAAGPCVARRIESDSKHWSAELERASEDVEEAFREKLEATTTRRVWEEETAALPQIKADARLRARQKKLELESVTASKGLAEAQHRKLAAQTKLRAVEADAERRRAHAEAACQNLRQRADLRLRDEETRLQQQYALAASRLAALNKTRTETEDRLRQERERIDAEIERSRASLAKEARKIKDGLAQVKVDSNRESNRIRSEEAGEEEQLRREAESALREDRSRLEAQFAHSVAALQKAQRNVDDAQRAKTQADEEANRVVATMRAVEENRRKEADARRKAQSERLREQAARARQSLGNAQQAKEAAETKRRAMMHKLARIRAASGEWAPDETEPHEDTLQAEIKRMDADVSEAAGQLDAARRAADDADTSKLAGEEMAARQRATEEELRLDLAEEAEDWLRKEREHSSSELEKAEKDLAEKWALKERADDERRDSQQASDDLLADISAQLDEQDTSLQDAIGEKAFVEEQAALARSASDVLATDKEKAREGLEQASKDINRLKRQGLLE